jgi:multiple sugar transport system substrate-binding protein
MRTKRFMAVMAAVAAVATSLSLAGCSPGTSSGGDDSGAAPKVLSLEDYYTAEPQKSLMEGVYNTCGTKVGVKVEADHIATVGLMPKILQQSSSKTLPDVLMIGGVAAQQIAASGALSPLSDYGITGKGIPSGVLKVGTYEGKLYAVAPVVNTPALFYNKDVLEAAGIQPPKTWDELSAAAKQLTEGDRYGLAFSAFTSEDGTSQFLPFMWSNGGSEKNINTPETVQALQFLVDLVNDHSASNSVVTWKQADVLAQFQAGKAAMMINGPWEIPALNSTPQLHWASVEIPTRLESQDSIVPLGGEVFSVPQTGDKAAMATAGKLVSCIIGADSQLTLGKAKVNVPSLTAVANQIAELDPSEAPFVNSIPTARARTAILGPDYPATSTKINTAEQLALTGKASPADALEQAASK